MLAEVAYITTGYPAPSHTFIMREVQALRRRGVRIATTSVHRAECEHLLTEEDRREFETTHALLPPRWREIATSHLIALIRHPRAFVSTLRVALGMARRGWRGRLWQLFYFAEALTAWSHWRRVDARHIHAHFVAAPSDVALLAAHFGRVAGSGPQTWSFTVHGLIELWDVQTFRLAEKVRRADAVICISDFTRSQLMAMVEEDHWAKLQVVHCGVVPADYTGIGEPPSGPPCILCVARLVPEKGHSVLLRALALLRDRGVEASLELVGDGPSREHLGRLVADLNLEDRVRFAGTIGQHEMATHYENAAVVCLPSFCEGVPVVLMEAMACGRAVIASAVAGVRELVRDRETGLLVSPGREDELADGLEVLLRGPDMRRSLGDAARRHVARHYDVDESAARLSDLFGGLHGEHLSRARWTTLAASAGAEQAALAPTELVGDR